MKLRLAPPVSTLHHRSLQAKLRSSVATLLVVIAVLTTSSFNASCFALPVQASVIYWSGEADGFSITWTGANLLATRGSTTVFSAREFAQQGLRQFVALAQDPESKQVPDCAYERRFRLLAVVGSLLSFSDQYYASCPREAHPGGETRFTTIDLTKRGRVSYSGPNAFGEVRPGQAGKAVQLTDIFSEEDIYNRLKADPKIARLLAQDDPHTNPKRLSDLLNALTGKIGSSPDCFSVPSDLLTRFAFRHLDATGTTIELGLPGAGPCRDDLTTILLKLPTSPKIRFSPAQNAQASFLNDVDPQTSAKQTVVRLRTVHLKK
jgi:hypothetical protein